jgi:hypothetical protein
MQGCLRRVCHEVVFKPVGRIHAKCRLDHEVTIDSRAWCDHHSPITLHCLLACDLHQCEMVAI